ncbi:hypothetical protein [Acinetobacter rudis]|uniref:Uncharacterized protein n=1 Tax=Acinetobacter rudis TaxID=632955 RepID=A0AAW8J572_9GAMM|nr:hypothetical protein [Acinetobacter rudis]MDQ8934789.1 hypothetical protein [Acinetobacter rudis]MDQ8951453.1 hypothetical protein [Acinetobacter rudis]MDQ9017130.1 hypothetical protein [Acinetobacter rudis]
MSNAVKLNKKVILFCALGVLIPLALIWLNKIAIDHDAATKREYDELIRKQQALIKPQQASNAIATTADHAASAPTQPE